MIGYLVRRVVQAIIVVFGVILLTFLLEHIIPGGAARAALGQRATPAADRSSSTKQNGYDLPICHQFCDYCRGLVLHFNLGYSYKKNQTVSALIQEELPKTLVLVGHLDRLRADRRGAARRAPGRAAQQADRLLPHRRRRSSSTRCRRSCSGSS